MKVKSVGQPPNNNLKLKPGILNRLNSFYHNQKVAFYIFILLIFGIIPLIIIYLLFIVKSDYEKGVESLTEKNYYEAIQYFVKIKPESPYYNKATKKSFFAAGMLANEEKRWGDALKFFSAELDSEDQKPADSVFSISSKKYFESFNLQGLEIIVTLNFLKYSGIFTKGCEIIIQLSNNSIQPLILNSDNFSILTKSNNKYYKSSANPNKTNFINTNSLAGKNNYAYSFAVKKSATLKMMLNFDDINSSEVNSPENYAVINKNKNDEFVINLSENELVFNLQENVWLIYPLNKIILSNPSNNSIIMNSDEGNLKDKFDKSALNIVKKWINAIGNNDLRIAYDLMTKKKAGDFEKFSSSYGGISKTNIFNIITEKAPEIDADEEYEDNAIIFADYESFDLNNKDGRFKQRFYLTIFDENGDYETDWKIYDIKNVEVNFYN